MEAFVVRLTQFLTAKQSLKGAFLGVICLISLERIVTYTGNVL